MRLWLYLVLIIILIPSSVSEINAGTQQTVRILFTNNSNGKLVNCNCPTDPYGGLAERVSLINAYRARHDSILLLDSGGYFGLSDVETRGYTVLKLMDSMGYDTWGIGEQEIYYGLDAFLGLFGDYSNKIVNASLYTIENKPVFSAEKVFTVNGIRFGIIGLVSEETFRFFPEESMDFTVEDPDSTLKRLLPVLKRSSDYIIVLSQMGKEKDEYIAEQWPDIDLIIGGHSQTLLKKAIRISDCRIVQAGKNGGHVGEIILTFDSSKKIQEFSYRLIEVSDNYTIPSDIKSLLGEELQPALR